MNPVSFAVIMPIGPGEEEVERAADVLDSLFTYEPDCRWLVLIDDVRGGRNLEVRLPRPAGCKCHVFIDPRKGRGNGWSGGMCVGVAAAVRWLGRETDATFAVRLDTDSLVIAPFADKVAAFFRDRPDIGVAGTYTHYPDGNPRADNRPALEPYTLRLGFYRNRFGLPLHIRAALLGRARRRRLFIERALANGYQLGEVCHGGGYAISRDLLDRLAGDGDFADVFLFRSTRLCEDVMMTIACWAAGLQAVNYNGPGEPFGVTYRSLFYEPRRLLELGYSVIHSVKTAAGWNETKIRDFFRLLRRQRSATVSPPTQRSSQAGKLE